MIKVLRTLLPYIKPYAGRFAAAIFFLIITNFGQIAIPQMLRIAIDRISTGGFSLRNIAEPLLGMAGFALAVALGRFGWRTSIYGASRRIEHRLRESLYAHLLTLSSKFYSSAKTGDLMARATNDITNVRDAAGIGIITGLDGLFMVVAILIIMFGQNARIALLTIAPTPIVTLLVLGVSRVLGTMFRRVQESFAGISEHAQEAISGVRVLKSFVREQYSMDLFAKRNDEYRQRNLELIRVWGLYFPIITFLSGLATLLLLRFGGVAVIDGSMTPGTFVAFMSYLQMIVWPMLGAGYTINVLQRGAASLTRLNEILDTVPDIRSPENPVRSVASAAIEIKNLEYRYAEESDPVISSQEFSAPVGTTIGIIGRTGSGKSTMLKLIPRLLDPPPGTVFLGGVDIRLYSLETLRGFVGIVPQDTFLFSDTIRENIAFGRPDATDEEIRGAAEMSTIDRDLRSFPDGFETQIGERGVTLSGGQKQRVAISRAILANPELLIFDDALSAVDTETEELILKRFLEIRKGKTNIVVSNRVSTLAMADRIYVFDSGSIVASGSHEDLMRSEGLYRRIAELQSLRSEMR